MVKMSEIKEGDRLFKVSTARGRETDYEEVEVLEIKRNKVLCDIDGHRAWRTPRQIHLFRKELPK